MDADRVKEIINSMGVIEVLYQGSPVWMERIIEDRVQIQNLDTQQRIQVMIDDLVEG